MDLPTCPSCKQSVLEDDAVECPFCGAPMKGGSAPARSAAAATTAQRAPAARPAAPPARAPGARTAPTASEASTGTKSVPAVNRPSAGKAAAEDDPFAVDQTATADAIPVSARPGPGKSLEVACPMCETKGYVSPKAAGRAVKCCNPKCLVPIFTAPAPQKAEAPPPPPAAKPPIALYAGIGVVVIGAAVAAVIYLNREPGPSTNTGGKGLPYGASPVGTDEFEEPKVTNGDEKKTVQGEKTPAADTSEELTKRATRRMLEASLGAAPVRKAYCRRLAATAAVYTGDVKAARDELAQLQKVGASTPYEAISPNVEIAWRQLDKPQDLQKSIAEIERLVKTLPENRGLFEGESAIDVAALLTVAGKADEAHKLLDAGHVTPQLDQLAAALRVVDANGTFNLDQALIGRSLGDWLSPFESGVTLILIARGKSDEALAWAEGLASPVARAEATLVWAEALARRSLADKDASAFERAAAAAVALPPAVQARLQARLADLQLGAGDQAAAAALIGKAQQLLGAAGPSQPVPAAPPGKPMLDLKLPDPAPMQQSALAAAEIAGVQARMRQAGPAWKNIELAMDYLRGMAPSKSLMEERVAQLEPPAIERIRADLKSDLQLRSDEEIRRALTRYGQKCKDVQAAAVNRFDMQAAIFEAAANFGLLEQVWDEVQRLDARRKPEEREPFLGSAVPMILAARYEAAGKPQQAAEIREAAFERVQTADPQAFMRAASEDLLRTGKLRECVVNLNVMIGDGKLQEWSLRLACRLAMADKTIEALDFTANLSDKELREDGLKLVSALATRRGHAADIWKLASQGKATPEVASICAGVVIGLHHPAAKK